MTVAQIDEESGLALCADGEGARHAVEIALVEQVIIGERLLVHAGVAIASLPGRQDRPRSTRCGPGDAVARWLPNGQKVERHEVR